jgi:hypothetical protein
MRSGTGASPRSESGPSDSNAEGAAREPDPDAGQRASGSQSSCAGGFYSRSGIRAQVQIVVSLETLLGLDDEPAELAGHGPVTAATARDLAFGLGSTWRRLVTDPVTGYLLDYGRKTYRPPAALADHVRARDLTCRTPNCLRPATKCDLDHVISWPAGATSEQNLQAKCDLDHRLKHEGRWRHQMSTDPEHPPGTVVMVSPTGHVYLSHQHSYLDPPLKRPEPPEQSASPDHRRPPRDADPGDPPF